MLRAERGGITKEEAGVRELPMEASKDGGKGAGVGGEVLVPAPLVVIQPAHLAKLEILSVFSR